MNLSKTDAGRSILQAMRDAQIFARGKVVAFLLFKFQQLDPKVQVCLKLRLGSDVKTFREIGNLIHTSAEGAGYRLRRGQRSLRRCLGRSEFENHWDSDLSHELREVCDMSPLPVVDPPTEKEISDRLDRRKKIAKEKLRKEREERTRQRRYQAEAEKFYKKHNQPYHPPFLPDRLIQREVHSFVITNPFQPSYYKNQQG